MTRRVDLNADLGEGFGPWRMGDDTALLDIVTSANVACGMHAGDPQVMAQTMRVAVAKGVGIGAHPGFADLQGFGRRPMFYADAELRSLVQYQIGAAQALARAAGGRVVHLKLHGALSNMAAKDEDMARCCYEAALDVDPDLVLVVQAETALHHAARALGCAYAAEIFADRAYAEDGTLVPRSQPGAVLHDAELIAARVTGMLREGAIVTEQGTRIPTDIDTICVHGDEPGAVEVARTLRDRLSAGGFAVRAFGDRRLA
ncbi:MAG: 5-oxoprolinase subunit PxpA [Pseudomonadota bacterium]